MVIKIFSFGFARFCFILVVFRALVEYTLCVKRFFNTTSVNKRLKNSFIRFRLHGHGARPQAES